jgi:hypothetical protein
MTDPYLKKMSIKANAACKIAKKAFRNYAHSTGLHLSILQNCSSLTISEESDKTMSAVDYLYTCHKNCDTHKGLNKG